MQLPEKFKEYAELVSQQLRWKKARPVIEREITTHLCDQRDALVNSGMDEATAVDESIRQMGDAVEIGTGLDRIHRPKPSWSLLLLTAILVLMGLAIKAFLTYDADYPNELSKMLVATAIGFVCLLAAYFIDFTVIGKWSLLVYGGVAVLTWYSLISHIPIPRTSSSIWPIYFVLLFPLAYAALLYKLRGKRYWGLVLSVCGAGVFWVCFALAPSMAAMLIVMVTSVALLAVVAWGDWFQIGKTRGCIILTVLVLAVAAACLWRILNNAYMLDRLQVAFHPEFDPAGKGWMGMMIREILSGAQMIGRGDAGRYAAEIPAIMTTTSFLLMYLIHTVGWIAFLAIMAVFAVFFVVAVYKCLKQKNMLGRMVSLAVILTLAMQVILYVILNLGFYLIEDICLPLVSYGNIALVFDMILIGVMLSVFRSGSLVRDESLSVRSKTAWQDHVRWNDGELTISFKKKIVS